MKCKPRIFLVKNTTWWKIITDSPYVFAFGRTPKEAYDRLMEIINK